MHHPSPFVRVVITNVQPCFGDEAAKLFHRLKEGGSPGHRSWPAGAGRCGWPGSFCKDFFASWMSSKSSDELSI